MKIHNLFNKKGGLILTGIVLVATSLTSCLKDNGPGSVNFADSPALIDFQYTGGSAAPYAAAILPNAGATYTAVEVTLSVSSITLGSAVTANIVNDAAGADSIIKADAANGITDNVMPTSLYTVPSTVTIPAGKNMVVLPFVFPTANTIDFTKNYVIAVKLASPNGAKLTSNLNSAVLRVILKSPYEGTYNINGFVYRSTTGVAGGPNDTGSGGLGGNFSGFSQSLTTITANQVSFAPLWSSGAEAGGVAGTSITVDPATYKVTMSSTGNTTLQNAAGYNNHYDPATKTFYISFQWNAGGRAQTDTLTLQ